MPIRGKEEKSHTVSLSQGEQATSQSGECEVFQISGPATQGSMAAAEAGGTLMRRREMAAGSSPCWSTPIPVGKGLARSVASGVTMKAAAGNGRNCKPAPRTPSRHSFHSRSSPVRHSGWTGDFAWTAEAKGNIYLDRWSIQSAEVWPGGGEGHVSEEASWPQSREVPG